MDGYGNDAMMMDVDMSKDMEIKITEVRHTSSALMKSQLQRCNHLTRL